MTEENSKDTIDLFLIIIGWLLGIFSAIVVEQIRRYISKRDIKKGIFSELREIQLRLAALCFTTVINYEDITEDWAKWIRPYYKTLTDSEEYDYIRNKPRPKTNINDISDKEFYEYLLYMKSQKEQYEIRSSHIHSEITLPYLNSNYNTIALLNKKVTKNISKLQREIASLNSDFQQIWFYHTKTFEKITDDNHKIASMNIDFISKRISIKAKRIISLIEKIFSI